MAWVTLSRRSQVLRGHDLRGKVLWERPLPWKGGALHRLGRLVLATAADGRAWHATDRARSMCLSGAASDPKDMFVVDPSGVLLRLSRRGAHLICSTLDSRVRGDVSLTMRSGHWLRECQESRS